MREKEVREIRDEGLNSGTGQNSSEKGLKGQIILVRYIKRGQLLYLTVG